MHFASRVFPMRNFKSAGTRNPCYLFYPPISRLTVALATKFLKIKILLFLLLMNTTLKNRVAIMINNCKVDLLINFHCLKNVV